MSANEEVAETLMELLPPVGWADVATKRDLDHLEGRLGSRMEAMETRLRGELHGELHRQLRQDTYWIMASLWAAVGVAVGSSQALRTVLGAGSRARSRVATSIRKFSETP